jgi:fatty acyl-CoA reductase
MQELLPSKIVTNLRNRQKITVLEGDITKDNFGLIEQALTSLRKRIPIFVHAASSLSVRQGLPRMASIVVHPSVAAAQLALTLTHLERFVFVATAYVNSFLHCSYLYREEKTDRVWQQMSPEMRETWPLWTKRDPADMSR